ncbi:Gfo/Idh/MocA family protein [Ammoniphilus sp. YIM 78166]|uniref:Gfo/Idh/MocA family oxidoreductase n=1 Tax=Ammoniphilus sp. YIM 78166 TaxID=1644106 RepID=UPI001F117AE5|nr:Gfo/Idh/MocA family oxidoreductase [Ammoniphilus sp. YIM 78166]
MSDHMLRIGIVGLGNAGSSLLPAISRNPQVKVTAACGRNKERLEKFAADYQAEHYYSVEDLCKSKNVDAVYIASPTELHSEHVKIAAEHQKHILVEKPIAVTLEEAQALIHLAEKNGVHMIVGHSHSFEPPIRKIREIVRSGELGSLKMLHNWYFNDWIYRPRTPDELNTELGGGVTYRQGSHQFDIIRYIAGGKVRSVRAMAGIWDPERTTQGAHTAFLEFESGVAATAVYNGYDHFHTTELTFGIGEGGPSVKNQEYGFSRRTIKQMDTATETALKTEKGYGGTKAKKYADETFHQPFFGFTLVSCERGDIRQSPNGLLVYAEDRRYEIALPEETGRDVMISELYQAIHQDIPPVHDGRWGLANLEVCLAVLESSETKKEIYLSHQVAVQD